ncbi:RNA-dependent RNA polymerase [Drosophila affinis sigmavirus]|uniref:Replicase n=2 Tax=Drosophila affinis sigmavirus TaxID=1308859 RepID=A0A140D8K4_9RHAB|nr:RNA-dependent RNA polymerase [Drosophila affinis sigmavirus]ACU65445.1 RNA-dependent RNA polymerase [Drosophila affinis sigmavirus 10]AMK09228.1 RNA-dependent RNA polymerase [Drosophila affinis sigmavirus]
MENDYEDPIGCDIDPDHFTESYDFCEDDIIPTKASKISTNLSNKDYSLDSPLIRDEIDDFIKYWSCSHPPIRWVHYIWTIRRKFIIYLGAHRFKPLGADKFFHWFGSIIDQPMDKNGFDRVWRKTIQDAKITTIVPDTFFDHLLGKIPTPHQVTNDSESIGHRISYGRLFWEFHLITLALNISSSNALDNFAVKVMILIRFQIRTNTCFVIKLNNIGEVWIMEGMVYLAKHNMLMDRNMVLMVKDTVAARFHTLLAIENRYDTHYTPHSAKNLISVYKSLDKVLEEHGESAYDLIKMVEPICNLQLSALARAFRPSIPEFPNFRRHIETSINKLCETIPQSKHLLQKLRGLNHVEDVLTVFGSFRHWGHPFINYKEGLNRLYTQVTMKKEINVEYANGLASEMSKTILMSKFKETSSWSVYLDQMSKDHPLYNPFVDARLPDSGELDRAGKTWHLVPIKPCFKIPDIIDPSNIYSDKSHSLTRSELIELFRRSNVTRIPSHKVLKTFINSPSTCWPEFLQRVNDQGLDDDSLIIGLKAKEREIKKYGRFYALMSWELREYFVVTEYLIKTFFLPFFKGLTMADDLTMLVRKMMDSSNGQGGDNDDNITIANHLDFEKWNNHQRAEATDPVFRVMGQFIGYPNLFTRTHEFFEKSWIYYADRGDGLAIIDGNLVNKGPDRFCWNGQPGGLEGLRQKGWSLLSLLIILLESQISNTSVKCLAQGDNQVICTQYKLNPSASQNYREAQIANIVRNNNQILLRVEQGTNKLGLIINRDETMQSADYMTYGKLPVFRGNFRCLEGKRWSRVLCITNDQLPTFGNIMSTISSNALTVSHFSESPVNPIYHYNLLGNFGRVMNEFFNPATQCVMSTLFKRPEMTKSQSYKIASLYLDPSFGGVGGVSLTRFLIRNFPDPVTESLTFFRIISNHTDNLKLKALFIQFGNPTLEEATLINFSKLLEDPLALNINAGLSVKTTLRNAIRQHIIANRTSINNELVAVAAQYLNEAEQTLNCYLHSINPLFPRFISQFKSASFFGVANSIVGLFENSKTIRNAFTKSLGDVIDRAIVRSEIISITSLGKHEQLATRNQELWRCSSSHADKLRKLSWGRKVIGATIPHPAEMIGPLFNRVPFCKACSSGSGSNMFVSVMLPKGLIRYWDSRGPFTAYLGSSTSESTSILRPWEKETDLPVIKKAADLRKVIGWFVDNDSNLASAILANLESLTGEKWDIVGSGFFRTGSGLHRYICVRQSNGGYSAQCPVKSTWMSITTNTMIDLGERNYDFMFQALIIYTQCLAGELHDNNPLQGWYHGHISCPECLREIEEPKLETIDVFSPPDLSSIMRKWKPEGTEWSQKIPQYHIEPKSWETITDTSKSYNIGRIEGFLFAEKTINKLNYIESKSLFPLTLQKKVHPEPYMEGLVDGIMRDVALSIVFRDRTRAYNGYIPAFIGKCLQIIFKLSEDDCIIALWRHERFEELFATIPRKIPPSYPTSNSDLGALGRNYLRYKLQVYTGQFKLTTIRPILDKSIWIFADVNHTLVIGLLVLSQKLLPLIAQHQFSNAERDTIRSIKQLVQHLRGKVNDDPEVTRLLTHVDVNIHSTPSEVRHAAKYITQPATCDFASSDLFLNWGPEFKCSVSEVNVYPTVEVQRSVYTVSVPRIQDPLISGLRLFQAATGSHYKVRGILYKLSIRPRGAICGGDGSGGISAMVLRTYPHCKVIFNSLLDLTQSSLRGSEPSPPAAISCIPGIRRNCINYDDAWQHPNDLAEQPTWDYFSDVIKKHKLNIDLIILDMEVQKPETHRRIMDMVETNAHLILGETGCLIFKTYLSLLFSSDTSIVHRLVDRYMVCKIFTTSLTSSHSSEVYCVFGRPKVTRTPPPCYPDMLGVAAMINEFPSQSTRKKEFERALQINVAAVLTGVPTQILSDPHLEFVSYLHSIGVRAGVANTIMEVIKMNKVPYMIDWPLFVLLSVLNDLIDVTHVYSARKDPPSDQKIINIGAFLCGFFKWMGWALRRQIYNDRAQTIIEQGFPFTWDCVKSAKTKGWRTIWSVCGHGDVKKLVMINHKMSSVGFVIRYLTLIFGTLVDQVDSESLAETLRKRDSSLSYESFLENTDILQYFILGKPIVYTGLLRGFDIERGECRENTWVS